jgi:hypothetical protein
VEKGEPLGRLSPAVTKRGKQGMGGAADRRGQEAGGDGGTDNRSQGGGVLIAARAMAKWATAGACTWVCSVLCARLTCVRTAVE